MKFLKIKPIVMAVGIALLIFSSGNVFAGGPSYQVIINEFFRNTNLGAGDEWIEIVLLQNLTAAELDAYSVGDSQGSTTSKVGEYQFTTMSDFAQTFCAGTVITVGGTAGPTVDNTYDPANNNWNLSLQTAGANITTVSGGGDFANDDVVYIDTNALSTDTTLSSNGFAINWDDTPATFGSNATFNLSTGSNEPNNDTGAFLNDVLTNAIIEASWVSDTALGSLTPGMTNGGGNTTSIQVLRTAALGTVTIADTPTNNEGNAGNTAFTFTVTRTASCAAASVDYAVTGTGANPADAADFGGALPSGTANFAAGVTTATITINVSGDTAVEMDETFLVTISNSAGVTLGTTTTDTGTISNDDVLPLVVSVVSVTDETSPGANDGTASVAASGGVPPYTYLWNNGATTATITGLMPGTYTVVVTDNNGAGVSASPAAPIVVVAALPPAIIPTLNQYMIMFLMLLVGLVAVKRVRVKA